MIACVPYLSFRDVVLDVMMVCICMPILSWSWMWLLVWVLYMVRRVGGGCGWRCWE